jgi:hypothetical protein
MRCPECHGQTIKVWAQRSVEVVIDEGDVIDEEDGDLYWDGASAALCMDCTWQGVAEQCHEEGEDA